MQKIAICEDENIWRDQLIQILNSIKTEGELKLFSYESGEDFLEDYTYGKYDIIFMDIYMKTLSGVETIKRLREIDKDVTVVFTTTSTEYALSAYRLNVIKYLEKPIKSEDVIECLRLAKFNNSNKKQLTIVVAGKECSFYEEQILFFEQQNHLILLHLTSGETISFSGKLDSLVSSLPDTNFYRCHKSYIVNLANVIRLDNELKIFIMKDNSTAYIKRENLKDAGIRLDKFLFDRLRKDI